MIRETGRVWSGAVITPRDGQMFIGITGQWEVPAITLPATDGGTREGGIVCSSSTWIGLDGAGSYLHSSLPQIGTIQRVVVTNGQMEAQYFAFHEWWCAGHYFEPNRLDALVVTPGNLIKCTLNVDTPTHVTFRIENQSTGIVLPPIAIDAHTVTREDGSPPPALQRRISGATAEWITERPSAPDTIDPATNRRSVPYELANYGKVTFKECTATTSAGVEANLDQTLAGLSLRNMYAIRNNHVRRVSATRLLGPKSVETFYMP